MGNLPYAQQIGTLENMLQKIQTASVPDKFSGDFVSTKLSMKGGTARSTIPFIKKMGFVTSDGTPTKRYAKFRNLDKSGSAIAESMRELYQTLFEMNEYVYELDSENLKRLIVEATGDSETSTSVAKTLATFNSLKKMADFDTPTTLDVDEKMMDINPANTTNIEIRSSAPHEKPSSNEGINLAYTINLNLPATKDIEVFNAIFKSLKQHLLRD